MEFPHLPFGQATPPVDLVKHPLQDGGSGRITLRVEGDSAGRGEELGEPSVVDLAQAGEFGGKEGVEESWQDYLLPVSRIALRVADPEVEPARADRGVLAREPSGLVEAFPFPALALEGSLQARLRAVFRRPVDARGSEREQHHSDQLHVPQRMTPAGGSSSAWTDRRGHTERVQ